MKHNIRFVWLIPASMLCCLLLLIACNGWHQQIFGADPEELTVECGTAFVPKTPEARLCGRTFMKTGVPIPLQSEGAVDTAAVGDYQLTYSCGFLWMRQTVTSCIHVRDTAAPVIQLFPDDRPYVRPDEPYEDPGYTAFDLVDGDLTGEVEISTEGNLVRYTVSDRSGNTASAQRNLRFADITPPELRLEGETEMVLNPGEAWAEPGYTALDDLDGDLTGQVIIEGVVGEEPGTYTLRYTVEDSFHNQTSVLREVTVPEPPAPEPAEPNGKVIYLTFDDGPSQYTAQLLEILDRYHVKATFFVVNYGYTDMIAKEAEAGHSVGVHSKTHDYNTIYASEEAYFADLEAMNEIICAQTGSYSNLIRFPGGSSNKVSSFNPGIMTRLTQAVTERGYHYFDWNVSSGDAGLTTDPDEVYENVISGISSHDVSIVLQHDSKGYSVEAVERIIVWGLENGYTFLPLTEDSPGAHHHINN